MTDTLQAALYSIPADDRETWVQMGMAIKSELGDAGFDLWNIWSRQSDRYKATDARVVWRSIRPNGGITIATLYHLAKENGWAGQAPVMPRPTPEEIHRRREQARREAEERERAAQRAVDEATKMLQEAELGPHDYLVAKGFPDAQGLVLDGKLLVPMRSVASGALHSIQSIAADGSKKFLPGGKAKGAVYNLGRSWPRWYVEGYATGLSVQAALKRMYREDQVVVCFSAGNLAHIAPPGGATPRAQYVIADHDWWRCPKKECRAKWDYESKRCPSCGSSGVTEPAGEKHAKQTGLPYWMPNEPGTDANDVMLSHGVEALADAMREVHMTAMPRREVVA